MNATPSAGKLDIWPERPNRKVEQLLADASMVALFAERPPEFMRTFQLERLRMLVSHARGNSAFWSDCLRDVSEKTAFSALPILDRVAFRAYNDNRGPGIAIPPEHGATFENATSGSSGVPARFRTSELHQRMIQAHNHAAHVEHKRDLSRTMIAIINTAPDHSGDFAEKRDMPIFGYGRRLMRKRPAFTIEQHAAFLARTPAAYLVSFPSLMDGVADCYEAGDFPPPRFSQVMTFGETVTTEHRERARALFGARIYDTYSCEEVGQIAQQCPVLDDYYHVSGSSAFVEIVGDDGAPKPAGEVGRVIVTSLHNYASPTIRYDIGDAAAMLPSCPCGHAQPALTRLLGRRVYLLRLPSGERQIVHIGAKYWLPIAPFRETRLVQKAHDRVTAEIVLDRPLTEGERNALVEMLREKLSSEIEYEIDQVERIVWAPTHKRQQFVSLI